MVLYIVENQQLRFFFLVVVVVWLLLLLLLIGQSRVNGLDTGVVVQVGCGAKVIVEPKALVTTTSCCVCVVETFLLLTRPVKLRIGLLVVIRI